MCSLVLFLKVYVSGCAQEQLFDIHLLYLLQETISSISGCFLIVVTHLLSVQLFKYSFSFFIVTRLAHIQCHFWLVFLHIDLARKGRKKLLMLFEISPFIFPHNKTYHECALFFCSWKSIFQVVHRNSCPTLIFSICYKLQSLIFLVVS